LEKALRHPQAFFAVFLVCRVAFAAVPDFTLQLTSPTSEEETKRAFAQERHADVVVFYDAGKALHLQRPERKEPFTSEAELPAFKVRLSGGRSCGNSGTRCRFGAVVISGVALGPVGDNSRCVSKRLFDCPQCGAPVPFPSSIAVFAVCAHCQSMVVLRESGIERFGEMAALPPDLSPLQCGARGVWQGVAFELMGRVRVEWDGGSWTEWWAEFADHRSGWIAETQGFFTISFQSNRDGRCQQRRACKQEKSCPWQERTTR
jgi:hypothetical protein